MKKIFIVLLLSSLLSLSFFSCNKDSDCIIPNNSIYHSWVRLITDSQNLKFNAELKINTNNSFNFIVLDSNTTHTNSYAEFTLQNDTMTIIIDYDCNETGIYEFLVSDDKLSLIAVNDSCGPRIAAIQGIWNKK
ncbi:MAG: hypothetical protein K8S00_14190 [Bacteroidales bacterium]|nr:hypothetical protein [Bacteroidales bacterium]